MTNGEGEKPQVSTLEVQLSVEGPKQRGLEINRTSF
jgi:hypothetical protein